MSLISRIVLLCWQISLTWSLLPFCLVFVVASVVSPPTGRWPSPGPWSHGNFKWWTPPSFCCWHKMPSDFHAFKCTNPYFEIQMFLFFEHPDMWDNRKPFVSKIDRRVAQRLLSVSKLVVWSGMLWHSAGPWQPVIIESKVTGGRRKRRTEITLFPASHLALAGWGLFKTQAKGLLRLPTFDVAVLTGVLSRLPHRNTLGGKRCRF